MTATAFAPVKYRVRSGISAGLVLSVIVVLVVGLWALAPSLFTSQDPYTAVAVDKLQAPSSNHWFGTDKIGRDLFARVVYGSSLTLRASVIAVLIGFGSGALIGLVSGFFGGLVDDALMRVIDVLLSIPWMLVALMLVTALGPGTVNIAIAVGIGSTASFARLVRAEVFRVRTDLYVEAAIATGATRRWLLARHVLPNSIGPALVLVALEFGSAILAVSALSFLGFGVEPPEPEWGALVSEGRQYVATRWWLTTLPGLVVMVTVLSANYLGRFVERRGRDSLPGGASR